MTVQTTAAGRDQAMCGPVPRWVIVTTIAGTALIALGVLWPSFTAPADLAERAGIVGGQAWWVLPVASTAVSVSADAAPTVVADIVLRSGCAASIWAPPVVMLAITHPTVELTSHTRTGPMSDRAMRWPRRGPWR